MTQVEFDNLQVNDPVCWQQNQQDCGVVTDKGYAAVTITWDDGQTGIYTRERLTECGVTKSDPK